MYRSGKWFKLRVTGCQRIAIPGRRRRRMHCALDGANNNKLFLQSATPTQWRETQWIMPGLLWIAVPDRYGGRD